MLNWFKLNLTQVKTIFICFHTLSFFWTVFSQLLWCAPNKKSIAHAYICFRVSAFYIHPIPNLHLFFVMILAFCLIIKLNPALIFFITYLLNPKKKKKNNSYNLSACIHYLTHWTSFKANINHPLSMGNIGKELYIQNWFYSLWKVF